MRIVSSRPAIIVDTLPVDVSAADLQGKEADTLLLTWEQRRWMRGRFTTKRDARLASRFRRERNRTGSNPVDRTRLVFDHGGCQ
jgi:urease accessory protein UreE